MLVLLYLSALPTWSQSTDDKSLQAAYTLNQSNVLSKNTWAYVWQTSDGSLRPAMTQDETGLRFWLAHEANTQKLALDKPTSVTLSPGNGFLAVLYQTDHTLSSSELKHFSFKIFDVQGNERYSLEHSGISDAPPPACYVSDNGYAVLANGARGELAFYNANGHHIKTVDLFEDDIYQYEKPLACAISRDGDFIAAIAQKKPATISEITGQMISGEPHLILLTLSGDELWRAALKEDACSEVAISSAGKWIAVAQYSTALSGEVSKKISVFNGAGELQYEISNLFRKASFSTSGEKFFWMNINEIGCVDLVSRKPIWHWSNNKNSDQILADFAIDASGSRCAVLSGISTFKEDGFVYDSPKLMLLNANGKSIWKMDFYSNQFRQPSVVLTENGRSIGIGFINTYKIYEAANDNASKF